MALEHLREPAERRWQCRLCRLTFGFFPLTPKFEKKKEKETK
jgi:hypothetical protein